jgi:D-alanyl-lipoteichoic acid acyltransferase DltB (MBOAT superfamily)
VATSDFFIGKWMFAVQSRRSKKNILFVSILINIGILVLFKYSNFLLSLFFNISTGGEPPVVLDLIAPVGISYYIFKTLTYVLDIYYDDIEEPETNYLNYLLYVSFFPNILSGPILRAKELLPQIRNLLNFDRALISKGFFLILVGVFKKIVIADTLALNLVDRVFDSHVYFTSFEYLMAGYAYLVQLYFDFSGYTDMVIGMALLLGFTSTPNFNKPFLAQNISEFWRRWHITLSNWLRDYLFTPLSLKFRSWGNVGLFIAILLTFVICGIWHDANVTFIIWGTLHGLFLGYEIVTRRYRVKWQKKSNKFLYKFFSIFLTFHLLMFSFIFFRADNVDVASGMIKGIFSGVDFSLAGQWIGLYYFPFIIMIVGLLLHYTPTSWIGKSMKYYSGLHWILQVIVLAVGIVFIYQFYSSEAQAFIYLDF